MRFQVPQFTDVEDKIVGAFTFKQFIYLAGGGGACLILYSFLPFFLAILFMIPIAGIAVALAFVKINSRPFVSVAEDFFKYFMGNKLYIWKHQPKQPENKEQEKGVVSQSIELPKLTGSKLKEMNWELDVKKKDDK